MKIVKKNKDLAKKEQKEKEKKVLEDLKAREYLAGLRENASFQKYVVERIIKANIDRVTDLRNIKSADFNNLSEVGQLVLQAKATRSILEKILSGLMN